LNIHNYKNVFICATEQSGDNIGSCIINELLIKNKNIKFDGVGGSKISPFLNNQYFSLNDFKSIGIFEILLSLTKYIKMIIFLSKKIISNNYDLVITIDSPDFNYPLIKRIRKKNIIRKLYKLWHLQYGLGENIEQKNLLSCLMKYLYCLILKIHILVNMD